MQFDSYFGGVLVVFLSTLVSVAGLLTTRKLVDLNKLRASHEVGGYLLSVVGTLYAVLLGLVVVDAMQKFQVARDVTEREANCLADVFILASGFPEPKRSQLKSLCVKYGELVVNEEWETMKSNRHCPDARRTAVKLMQEVIAFEPKTEGEKAIYPLAVDNACQIWQNRRTRTNMAFSGIPTVEWVTLFAGAIITIFFTYFFGLENLPLQIIMTAMVSILISLNMFLVFLYGYPFSGELCISPDAFMITRSIFDNRVGHTEAPPESGTILDTKNKDKNKNQQNTL